MNTNTMELNLNEMEKATAGAAVQPNAAEAEAIGKLIEWIESWFD